MKCGTAPQSVWAQTISDAETWGEWSCDTYFGEKSRSCPVKVCRGSIADSDWTFEGSALDSDRISFLSQSEPDDDDGDFEETFPKKADPAQCELDGTAVARPRTPLNREAATFIPAAQYIRLYAALYTCRIPRPPPGLRTQLTSTAQPYRPSGLWVRSGGVAAMWRPGR